MHKQNIKIADFWLKKYAVTKTKAARQVNVTYFESSLSLSDNCSGFINSSYFSKKTESNLSLFLTAKSPQRVYPE